MKKSLLLFAVLFAAVLTACTLRSTTVNRGKTVTKNIRTAPFNAVSMLGGVDVHYVQDSVRSVKVVAPIGEMKRFTVYTEDSMLIIKPKDNGWRFFRSVSNDIDVYVTSPDLIGVNIAGSGDFEAKGHVDTDNMELGISGSGEIKFGSLICNSVSAHIAGSGSMELKKLTTGNARLEIAGSGDIDCDDVNIYSLKSSIAGSGSIEVNGKIKTHTEDVGGSGSVTVNGK